MIAIVLPIPPIRSDFASRLQTSELVVRYDAFPWTVSFDESEGFRSALGFCGSTASFRGIKGG